MVRFRLFALSLLVCISLSLTVAHAQVSESDSLALVEFYNAMGGSGWTFPQNSTPWLQGPVPLWYGIVTVTNKRVTWLVLTNMNLTGTLPQALTDLDQLGGLVLQYNQISGTLAGSPVLEMPNLRVLDLSQNLFTGEIPSEIGNLTQLENLSLGVNAFSGEIPSSIGSLTSLTWLQLTQNQLSGEIPTGLGNLDNLTTLGLHDNNLEGDVPADFAGLTSIISINLTDNQLTGFPALPPFPSLSVIYLNNNQFTFEDFEPSFDLFAAATSVLTPQADVEAVVDGMGTVSVTVGGASNVYQWYIDNEATPERDGFWIDGANNSSYTPTYAGDYYVRITNSYLDTLPGQFSYIELFSNIVRVVPMPRYLEVNTTVDDPDGDVNDSVCDTGSAGAGLTGLCTLRAAIETANGRGSGEITFDIPGGGIPSIQPTYAFPWIVVPVEIDGTTQPGGRVEISGNLAGPNVDGLVLAGGSSLVTGLVVNRFSGNGIVLNTNDNSAVENTYVGTTSSGTGHAGNGLNGIWIDDTTINRIGDVGSDKANVISANLGHGILITGENAIGNVVRNNQIGASVTGLTLGNGRSGIYIENASLTLVGGNFAGESNNIKYNGGDGISIVGAGDSNSIFRNGFGQNMDLAIDLGDDGLTGNDLGNGNRETVDTDAGPNQLANAPSGISVESVPERPGGRRVHGIVDLSSENPAPRIQIYATLGDKKSGNERTFFVTEAAIDESGLFSADVDELPFPFPLQKVSALTTNAAGSTSEFSMPCMDTDGDNRADTDGDGLCDNWEKAGIDYDGDGEADLKLQNAPFGASVTKKDLFVEADFMVGTGGHTDKPSPQAIMDVRNAFARRDINLYVEVDDALPHVDVVRFSSRDPGTQDDFDDLKIGNPKNPCGVGTSDGHFGTHDEREDDKCAAILGAKRLVFRYSIFGHSYTESPRSSGKGELPGNDFIVTLGSWSDDSIEYSGGTTDTELARTRAQAATFMHEMGHTLNLRHGGDDNDNCKTNYPSIMSYSLQFPKYISDRVLDYSQWTLAPLDKNNLDERTGLDGPANRKTLFWRTPGVLFWIPTNKRPLDWDGTDDNGDGIGSNDPSVAVDLNDRGNRGCPGHGVVLGSYNDWDNLLFNFRATSDFKDGGARDTVPPDESEITETMVIEAAESFDYDGDGYSNADDNCPPYHNPDQLDTDGDGVGDMCEQPVSDLIVEMSASEESVAPGMPISYTIAVYNVGPDTTAVSLVDTLATGLSLTSATPDQGSCSVSQNVVWCDLGDMMYDDSLGVTLVVEPGSEGIFENAVHVSSDYFDPDSTNNSASLQTVVSVSREEEDDIPEEFSLRQNYPNPFNPVTTIEYRLRVAGHVELTVLDLLGRPVISVVNEYQPSGSHSVHFNASDLSSGVYLYRLTVGSYSGTRRMVVLK